MPKYFVIIHVEDEQPLFGVMEDQPDSVCAEANFVAREAAAGRYKNEPIAHLISECLTPQVGARWSPHFVQDKMRLAWLTYYKLPGAVKISGKPHRAA